jgi:hypothetical protein
MYCSNSFVATFHTRSWCSQPQNLACLNVRLDRSQEWSAGGDHGEASAHTECIRESARDMDGTVPAVFWGRQHVQQDTI